MSVSAKMTSTDLEEFERLAKDFQLSLSALSYRVYGEERNTRKGKFYFILSKENILKSYKLHEEILRISIN